MMQKNPAAPNRCSGIFVCREKHRASCRSKRLRVWQQNASQDCVCGVVELMCAGVEQFRYKIKKEKNKVLTIRVMTTK